MIVGTAGHIDHGKSSLVRAITGIDPDRLKEEKQRGITIDLGYAYWPRPDGDVVGFVDVPGHEGLIHNMLAGATGIDFVILAVAVDDGVMPQTREHLAIVDLLGLKRGLVALTKADLAGDDRRQEVSMQIHSLLTGASLEGTEIVPFSAITGEGLEAIKFAMDSARATQSQRPRDSRFRLDIDRCFTLSGAGTVVTGTASSGTVHVGDRLIVSPAGLEARVRSIHAQNREAPSGSAGERCALALAGPAISKESVKRGQVLLDPFLHVPTRRIDASFHLLASERKPLGQWQPVRFHTGAVEIGARIVLLDDEAIAPGRQGFIQLVLDEPIAVVAGGRFILRDWTASRTIGGGTLIDLRAPERKRRTPERRAELAALAKPDPPQALETFLLSPRGWIDLKTFTRDRALSEAAAKRIVEALSLVIFEAVEVRAAMLPARWQVFRRSLLQFLDEYHRKEPDQAGLGAERLRLALTPRFPSPIFAAVLAQLAKEGEVALDRAWVRRPSHVVKLSAEEEQIWVALKSLLNGEHRFQPPRVRDVARSTGIAETSVRRLFKLAARRGDTDEIAHDHFFLRSATGELASIARELAGNAEDGRFNVIAFRDRIGSGRKTAIHVLEYFDRQGFTMRRGDWRRINPHRANLL
jgi:selenocysteine-specific elongation factor